MQSIANWGFILLATALLTVGCDRLPNAATGQIVAIGNTQFRVPPEYLHPDASMALSENNEIPLAEFPLLQIPIDTEPTATTAINDSDTFSMAVTPDSSRANNTLSTVSQRAADAWTQQGKFSDRIVKQDGPARLYRVYSRAEFPSRWHYFTAKPSAKLLESEWVAECWVPAGEAVAEGFGNVTCQMATVLETLDIDITFAATRLGCRGQIIERAKELLTRWQESA